MLEKRERDMMSSLEKNGKFYAIIMKKFVLNTKTKILAALMLLSFSVQADPVALVSDVRGKAFAVFKGRTVELERGDIVNAICPAEEASKKYQDDWCSTLRHPEFATVNSWVFPNPLLFPENA